MIDENFLSVRLLQALNIGAHRVEMEAVKHQSDIIAVQRSRCHTPVQMY